MMILPKAQANSAANGVFLISIGILILTNGWWPGIFLAIGALLFTRQFLNGRFYPACISGTLFFALFLLGLFNWKWSILAPVLLITAGIFLFTKEVYFPYGSKGESVKEEFEEDANLK